MKQKQQSNEFFFSTENGRNIEPENIKKPFQWNEQDIKPNQIIKNKGNYDLDKHQILKILNENNNVHM